MTIAIAILTFFTLCSLTASAIALYFALRFWRENSDLRERLEAVEETPCVMHFDALKKMGPFAQVNRNNYASSGRKLDVRSPTFALDIQDERIPYNALKEVANFLEGNSELQAQLDIVLEEIKRRKDNII